MAAPHAPKCVQKLGHDWKGRVSKKMEIFGLAEELPDQDERMTRETLRSPKMQLDRAVFVPVCRGVHKTSWTKHLLLIASAMFLA